jgi:hypothetical protein
MEMPNAGTGKPGAVAKRSLGNQLPSLGKRPSQGLLAFFDHPFKPLYFQPLALFRGPGTPLAFLLLRTKETVRDLPRTLLNKEKRMNTKGMLKLVGSMVACSLLLTLGSSPLLAKDRSESGDREIGQHRPLKHIKKVTLQSSYNQIFQKSVCIADCGDGTGFECSGPQTYCEDGLGCAASDGNNTVYGVCGAS